MPRWWSQHAEEDLTSTKANRANTKLNLEHATKLPRPKCFVLKIKVHNKTFDNSTE